MLGTSTNIAGTTGRRLARKWGVSPEAVLTEQGRELFHSAPDSISKVFPESVSDGVAGALSTSLQRVLDARAEGRLDTAEAAAGVEMLREMTEGLHDLASGNLVRRRGKKISKDVQMIDLQAADGDRFVVTTRRKADDYGQARIAIKQIADNGVYLDRSDQMHLRIDRCEQFGTAVDVQFGWGEVNEKIHGLVRDDNGEPVISKFDTVVPKHHFDTGISDEVKTPEGFAACVDEFLDGPLAVLLA